MHREERPEPKKTSLINCDNSVSSTFSSIWAVVSSYEVHGCLGRKWSNRTPLTDKVSSPVFFNLLSFMKHITALEGFSCQQRKVARINVHRRIKINPEDYEGYF